MATTSEATKEGEEPTRTSGRREPPTVRPSGGSMTIPFLSSPSAKLEFGRLDSDEFIEDIEVDVGIFERISRSTYNMLQMLSTHPAGITENQFVRVQKTLLLKRLMDIQEQEKGIRPANYIHLSNNMLIPRPLGDLLYAFGSFKSQVRGVNYHITCPPQAAQPQPWYNVDPNIHAAYVRYIHRNKEYYQMVEFPGKSQFRGTPLALTVSEQEAGMTQVRAYTNEPQMTDALIRFVNEEDLIPPVVPFNDCHLLMTERLYTIAIATRYVSGYVLSAS